MRTILPDALHSCCKRMSLDLSLFQPQRFVCPSLEILLTSPEYFALTTASPLQRAICRIIDGLPLAELASYPNVIAALGGEEAVSAYEACPSAVSTLVILAGVRSGKSLIAAAAITRAALTCDMTRVRPGEPPPRASIVSTAKDTAMPAWQHIAGHIQGSKLLSARLIGEPRQNFLTLRHESGAPVDIAVVAGARGASTLVARWSAGVIFDEAPRMLGEDEAVVNLDEARRSIAARMLPGAPTILAGSPHAAFGPVYDLVQKHHGKPSRSIIVIRARGPDMAPPIWTPEACEALRVSDPDAYRVDVECEFLDPESGLYSPSILESCIKYDGDLPPGAGHYYSAAIDPATRGNAWTLVVGERTREGKIRVALARQWQGSISAPLSPKATFADIFKLLIPYGLNTLHTDQWAADAMIEHAGDAGLWLIAHSITDKLKLEFNMHAGALVADDMVEFPRNRDLIRDLASVRRRTTQTGVSIHYPMNASGRHCDFAPALALMLQHAPQAPDSLDAIAASEAAELAKHDAAAGAREAARQSVQAIVRQQNKAWQQRRY